MKKIIPINKDHIRALKSPHDHSVKTQYAYVALADIPVDFPLSPNPRVPKPNEVIRRVQASLESNDGRFHVLNRGITISAKSAEFDNSSGLLTIEIPDGEEEYGILDGGHTYEVVKRLAASTDKVEEQYIKLEILTGVESFLPQIASARNFSKQVKDISLANYSKKLEWLKEAMGPVAKKVRWSENNPEVFDALEYIQAVAAFDIHRYDDRSHPIEAYKNAGKCLALATGDQLSYLAPVVPQLITLYDTIRFQWWKLYKIPDENGKGGRPGRLKEVQDRQRGISKLIQFPSLKDANPDDALYHVEKGLVIPLLSAFRSLLQEDSESKQLSWKVDPLDFWQQNGPMLIRKIMEASDQRNCNPHVVGRDKTVYEALYDAAQLAYFKSL